jgi:NADPH:quinone reductase-like Zn-dependent oxidoreductase
MPKAVRFNEYGDVSVLQVVDVPRPTPGPGEVVVRVKAAGINPGEAKVRRGLLHERWPATFPSGEGSDLAGTIDELGPGVRDWKLGDDVIGFTDKRASHAEYVIVEASHLTAKPAAVPWEVAGGLFVAGATAYAAVQAVELKAGDVVTVAGAAGGVGTIAVQLAKLAGARVIGIASPANHDWLRDLGVTPVAYGDGLSDRLRAASDHIDAFIDTVGGGYADLAVDLGIAPGRIDTIADFGAGARLGVKMDGNATGASAKTLSYLAGLIADGEVTIPVATYPLGEVQAAYRELERGHTRGKIVLLP